MYDLIAQIEKVAAGSITDEIRILKERRQTLDLVIKFTLGITRLQRSLESVLLLKKPARDIPRDLLAILGSISDHVANLSSNELSKRLLHIEKSIENDIKMILGISQQPDVLEPVHSSEVKTGHAVDMHKLVNDFRRRTNTAIVLKLHLRTRGIEVSESVFPVTADDLVSQVSRLVVEEKKCRDKSKLELEAMGQQVEGMINNETYPDEIRKYAQLMKSQINENIQHLSKGKDIESMPFAIEIIQLGEVEADSPEQLISKPHDSDDILPEIKPETTSDNNMAELKYTQHKRGFFSKFRIWLKTPWRTGWRDIE